MKKGLLILAVMFFIASGIMAQEELKPVKHENVTWHRVVLVNFKPGKVGRAKEIMAQYQAASDAVNLKGPERHWLITGEYNMMLIWTFENGPTDLEWSLSPNGVEWRKEMIRRLGSNEELVKLQQEYQSLVDNSTSFLTRKEL